jgi:hypothetical protein
MARVGRCGGLSNSGGQHGRGAHGFLLDDRDCGLGLIIARLAFGEVEEPIVSKYFDYDPLEWTIERNERH